MAELESRLSETFGLSNDVLLACGATLGFVAHLSAVEREELCYYVKTRGDE